MKDKPEAAEQIGPVLEGLSTQWEELENTTKDKGERLFDANRSVLYEQSCDDIDGWINQLESQVITEDFGKDLTTVNLNMQKQNVSICLVLFSFYKFFFLFLTIERFSKLSSQKTSFV